MIGASELQLIKKLSLGGMSVIAISRALCRSRVTIRKCLTRTTSKRRRRQPSNIVAARRRLVVALAKMVTVRGHRKWKTFGSASDIAKEIARLGKGHWSAKTISRDLKSCGFKSYVRPNSPCKSVECVAAKKSFARHWLGVPDSVTNTIVFSDESWSCTNEYGHRREWCLKGTAPFELEREARWNVPSVLCWGAIGVGYKSPLVVFPSKIAKDGEVKTFRLDSQAYIRRCLGTISSDLVGKKRMLQHDGARSHVGWRVKSYLKKKKIRCVENWPSKSPDFNMIEMLWPELHRRVSSLCPRTQDELVSAVRTAWSQIPQRHIDNLCKSWKKRLRNYLKKH